jgi:hypothetical protein
MNREDYNIEFVEDSFSLAKTSSCPNCNGWVNFLPDIKSLIKDDCKRVISLLKNLGLKIKEVERISVKEWTCNGCKTIYINIEEKTVIFD